MQEENGTLWSWIFHEKIPLCRISFIWSIPLFILISAAVQICFLLWVKQQPYIWQEERQYVGDVSICDKCWWIEQLMSEWLTIIQSLLWQLHMKCLKCFIFLYLWIILHAWMPGEDACISYMYRALHWELWAPFCHTVTCGNAPLVDILLWFSWGTGLGTDMGCAISVGSTPEWHS